MNRQQVDAWFMESVLPLEGALMRYLRANWRNESDLKDLRQDIYTQVYRAALGGLPDSAQAFVFATARNLLINDARRAKVVSIQLVEDPDDLDVGHDPVTPERHMSARQELGLLQAGLDQLPGRCREVVVLRKVEGLTQREVADRMGITEDTVERQTLLGIRALADFLSGGTGKIRRPGMSDKKRRPSDA